RTRSLPAPAIAVLLVLRRALAAVLSSRAAGSNAPAPPWLGRPRMRLCDSFFVDRGQARCDNAAIILCCLVPAPFAKTLPQRCIEHKAPQRFLQRAYPSGF